MRIESRSPITTGSSVVTRRRWMGRPHAAPLLADRLERYRLEIVGNDIERGMDDEPR
jgi:hypothetical protein